MKNTTIILGPPGTGKTTELLNLVDKYLQKGVDPDKIGFISFTKKSVKEAVNRAVQRFDVSGGFNYFRTIHSLCFRQLGMATIDIMNKKNYFELSKLLGVKITGSHVSIDQTYTELNKGDQMVFIESLSRLKCQELSDTYNDMNLDLSYEELSLYQRTLAKYKQTNLIYDFTDMLTKFIKEGFKPSLEVLFVDEAQDLCKLQWKIVDRLSDHSNKTYVAGDDDQAIFRWSGADVDYFIDLAKSNTIKVLHQSYRVPKTIHKFATKLSKTIDKRNIKEFKSTKEKGRIDFINSLEEIDFSKDTWLILVRNTYMLNPIIEHLRMEGFFYESIYDNVSNTESLKAAFLWERLRSDKLITIAESRLMLSFISEKHISKSWRKALHGRDKNIKVNMRQLLTWCNVNCSKKIWHEALDKISIDDKEYYIAARRRGEKLTGVPRIKVSTIHGAKGGEAEHVVLFTDISTRTYKSMMDNPDDEARVFYVGITRASKSLHIIQPQTPSYFSM